MTVYQPTTAAGEGEPPMVKKPSGGPAFPTDGFKYSLEQGDHQTGMSLRDYFAAKALPAMLGKIYSMTPKTVEGANVFKAAAVASYEMADAMLLARDK